MKLPFLFLTAVSFLAGTLGAERVFVLHDATVPQAAYAARKVGAALRAADHEVIAARAQYDRLINLSVNPGRLGAEAFAIIPEGKVITVLGGDDRGMIYGALALAEAVANGTPLADIAAVEEAPHQQFRGIKFNLPWETYRPSSALDQHIPTAKDLKYWEAFLDMMTANRFNAISLWNMHPFTFMIRPKNFPEASPWTDAEFAEWQHLYREIFRLAKERGLDTYIVHWSIFVSKDFADAHGVAQHNYYPFYYGPGDTSEIVRRYLRESVTQVLEEYPNLDGIGLSHGEGMGGMTPLERQQWMDDVIIAGALAADRPVKLIHRAPFSANLDSGGSTSSSAEVITRAAMERLGDAFEGPIWVEMKFNWSHAHSTPNLEKVHGGKLGDTYFKPVPENYKITWQARNEDFFALRWGVPDFIRQHIARNGGHDYSGGYFTGSECYIPALDYFTATDDPVDWTWAFQRQWLFYKLWGRLLYNPATPDAVFQAEYTRRYGPAADHLLKAMSLASSTQLRLASLYDSRWDFTLYSEGFLALQGETTKYIGVDALIKQGTMASEYVSVGDYVTATLAGESFAAERITPPVLIGLLERDNREALRLVESVDTTGNATLRYEVADIQTWAHLGLHLAEKLRGAVALQRFRLAGDPADQQAAIGHLERALAAWDEVIAITRPLYRDMRLTHYNHNSFERNDDNRFHWALIRDEVAADVTVAREATAGTD
ncbi:hypothetical protein [Synoicihabitans lomoniglobus]|uniref:Beta-hexosaminidase bacterial type N-terminal domain-containing protein n=1 Tax=Synoicihabitans lomoniglobus TaxID=2909285 RepID=A0AAF0CNI9_9BACT|nr:hypothetical protein [Opitutaceae bacterium LMO-M01]WED65583.1 hypothetical protein PXH66_01800 [Opitutaceae bacterium LMO-M01]